MTLKVVLSSMGQTTPLSIQSVASMTPTNRPAPASITARAHINWPKKYGTLEITKLATYIINPLLLIL